MASSSFLRNNLNQHTVKNKESKTLDKDIDVAVSCVIEKLRCEYPTLVFEHNKTMMLKDIIAMLVKQYPKKAALFTSVLATSFIKPDGGFLFASNKRGNKKLILVSEVKRQGTNDARKQEGLPKQALGNAIERLGKNLIGIRAIFKNEDLIPFVCFGSGDDFRDGSSILDRVITMNEFFPLNETFVEKDYLPFEPVSMMFRHNIWSVKEMTDIMFKISSQAVEHWFS
ncbi:MAG TPA: EcoRI family type II restriction endonuclease [Candidatus Woesebacteria bacterium]|nr:EcoRI family type II restriction endonuclease [Candidatus Woesebacteria bacterium]